MSKFENWLESQLHTANNNEDIVVARMIALHTTNEQGKDISTQDYLAINEQLVQAMFNQVAGEKLNTPDDIEKFLLDDSNANHFIKVLAGIVGQYKLTLSIPLKELYSEMVSDILTDCIDFSLRGREDSQRNMWHLFDVDTVRAIATKIAREIGLNPEQSIKAHALLQFLIDEQINDFVYE